MFSIVRTIILKFIFFVLTFTLLVCTFLSINVYADDILYTEGDYQYYIIDGEVGIRIAKYIGDDVEVYVPYSFGLYEVKAIDSGAFTETGVQKIHVYDNVTLIGANAFDEGAELVVQTVSGEVSEFKPKTENSEGGDSGTGSIYQINYVETKITLNLNYVTNISFPSIIVKFGENMPNVNPPSRDGFIFLGYYDSVENGKQYIKADGTSADDWDKDVETSTLYAHWSDGSTPDYEDISDDISGDFEDSEEDIGFFERLFGSNDDTTTEKDRKKVRNRLFELFNANDFASDFKAKPVGYFIIIFSLVSIVYLIYRYFNKR